MVISIQNNIVKSAVLALGICTILFYLLLPYNRVHAWTGNINTCGTVSLPLNLADEIRHIYSTYNDSSKSYIIWYNGSSYIFTSSIDSKKLEFFGSTSQSFQLQNNGSSVYTLQTNVNLPNSGGATDKIRNGYLSNMGYYENTPPSVSQNYTNVVGTTATCIVSVNNVVYNASYTGNLYQGTAINLNLDPKEVCQSLDVACYIRTSYEYIGDTFKDVTQAMLNVISDLFIPNGDNINTALNDIETGFFNQIGFLTFPVILISDVKDAFVDAPTYYGFTLPSFLGSGNWTIPRISDNAVIGPYIEYLRPILQVSILLALVTAYYHKYKEITA